MSNNNENSTTSSLQLIPETVLKKKHDLDEMKMKRAAAAQPGNNKVFSRKTKAIKIIKPEKFLSRATSRINHERRFKRVNKKGMQKRASNSKVVEDQIVTVEEGDERTLAVAEEEGEDATTIPRASNSVGANIVFAIRIRNEKRAIPANVKRALGRMRLRNVNEGVFLRYDEYARKGLHLVEPWVVYGVPSKATITDLLKRRGHLKIDTQRVPLTDNTLIEEHMSDYNMLCVEDIVHELHSVGEYFGQVSTFLWPFRLAAFSSKFQKRVLNMKDGQRGDYGDVGESMDDMIRKVL
uniref:Ribosomal protein L30 ferredoxin-like fold domain-containing protein n=1 Tax=Ditylum brightwellii TaxID=49249 RepID=A0A7S4V1L1_9STRA